MPDYTTFAIAFRLILYPCHAITGGVFHYLTNGRLSGSLSAGLSRFMAWKTADGKEEASHLVSQLETLGGVFHYLTNGRLFFQRMPRCPKCRFHCTIDRIILMIGRTGKIVLALDNPTILVITDRNDLDDQLFDTFAASTQLLRQEPRQVENRDQLNEVAFGSASRMYLAKPYTTFLPTTLPCSSLSSMVFALKPYWVR
jgi:hypothetical protein